MIINLVSCVLNTGTRRYNEAIDILVPLRALLSGFLANLEMTFSNGSIDTPPRAPSPVHSFGTLAVHAGSPHDPITGAVIEPVSDAPLSVAS